MIMCRHAIVDVPAEVSIELSLANSGQPQSQTAAGLKAERTLQGVVRAAGYVLSPMKQAHHQACSCLNPCTAAKSIALTERQGVIRKSGTHLPTLASYALTLFVCYNGCCMFGVDRSSSGCSIC